ncbi:MAG: ribonuclease III [Pseudomonadota bacterium]
MLATALTHSSSSSNNYERLEFLGDAVLGIVISHALYHHYPDDKEGDLARKRSLIVSRPFLASIAEKHLNLADYIIVSNANNETSTSNPAILADVLEAIIGAIYLDGGFNQAKKFIHELFNEIIINLPDTPIDPRSELQEWAQQRGHSIPEYSVVKREGPVHAPLFTSEVQIKKLDVTAQGTAATKKAAFADAASNMLNQLKANDYDK